MSETKKWDCEELAFLYLNDRDKFPVGIRVVTVAVEDDGEGKLRLRRNEPRKPKATGDNIASETVPMQEYEIDGVRGMAGYSSVRKVFAIGVVE